MLGFVLAELIPDKIDYTKIADGNVMKFSCETKKQVFVVATRIDFALLLHPNIILAG